MSVSQLLVDNPESYSSKVVMGANPGNPIIITETSRIMILDLKFLLSSVLWFTINGIMLFSGLKRCQVEKAIRNNQGK